MSFRLQPVQVGNNFDEEGLLVFDTAQRLVAVLVQMSELHEELGVVGQWYLEAGFGPVDGSPNHPLFANLDEALNWVEQRRGRQ